MFLPAVRLDVEALPLAGGKSVVEFVLAITRGHGDVLGSVDPWIAYQQPDRPTCPVALE
jgi:hypothetical protein